MHKRIVRRLEALDAAMAVDEMNQSGFDFHALKASIPSVIQSMSTDRGALRSSSMPETLIALISSNITDDEGRTVMSELAARRDPNREPTHPGELVREDILPALNLTVSEAATHLRVSRQALHRVLAGTAALTPVLALKIGKLTGSAPALLMRMQVAHDLWVAERNVDIASIPTLKVA